MLNVVYAEFHKYALYAEYLYAECCYSECRYAENRGPNLNVQYVRLPSLGRLGVQLVKLGSTSL
jgi:hypothetical protein